MALSHWTYPTNQGSVLSNSHYTIAQRNQKESPALPITSHWDLRECRKLDSHMHVILLEDWLVSAGIQAMLVTSPPHLLASQGSKIFPPFSILICLQTIKTFNIYWSKMTIIHFFKCHILVGGIIRSYYSKSKVSFIVTNMNPMSVIL